MTRPTLDSLAPVRRRSARAPRGLAAFRRLALGFGLVLALAACGGGSGGGSSDGSGTPDGGGEPLATQPVDLPPGQTAALIAWPPSVGRVTGYMVFLSRNGRLFQFQKIVDEPRTEVTGVPGDVVRILVAAIGDGEQTSATSPPSVPIRFHADPNATPDDGGSSTLPPVGGGVPDPTPDPTPDPAPDPTPAPETPPADPTPPAEPDPSPTPTEPVDDTVVSDARRALLLTGELASPLAGLSAATRSWVAPWLSGEVPTDVFPIATAASANAGWRDVVWQDAAGQLFVSDGPTLANADDPASTLVAGIALAAGERFVALVDLDGDGVRDWLIEDASTGTATLRSDAAGEPRSARPAALPETARLLGPGDLDGDARAELLWLLEDGALARSDAEAVLPAVEAGATPPAGYRIVALADLSGDGLDDLIARSDDGRLAVGTSVAPAAEDPSGVGPALDWTTDLAAAGLVAADPTAELIATLDLDDDDRAELVWRTESAVEIRGLGESQPRDF